MTSSKEKHFPTGSPIKLGILVQIIHKQRASKAPQPDEYLLWDQMQASDETKMLWH